MSGGTNGDANGFVAGISLATAGFPDNTLSTVGDLLDDGTDIDPSGHSVISANEQSLTYTSSGLQTADAIGYIHYWWTRTR